MAVRVCADLLVWPSRDETSAVGAGPSSLSLPSHQRINTTYSLMASGAPDAIAATLRHTRDVISNYAPRQWRFAFAHM